MTADVGEAVGRLEAYLAGQSPWAGRADDLTGEVSAVDLFKRDLRTVLTSLSKHKEALEQGAAWFEEYRELHLAKDPPDHAKAATNGMRAVYLRRASNPTGEG